MRRRSRFPGVEAPRRSAAALAPPHEALAAAILRARRARDSDHRVQNNSADRLRKARRGNDAGDDKPIDRMLQVLISSAIVKENNGT